MLLVRVPTKYLNIKVAPDIRPDNPAIFICGTGIRPDTVYGNPVRICGQVRYRYAAKYGTYRYAAMYGTGTGMQPGI